MSGTPSSPMLQAAVWYADLGYSVFPCAPGRKTPLTGHGLLDATTDTEQIERWWTAHPDANVAIRTDGLVAIDIDGSDNPWLADEPEKLRELACAPTSLTPRGGRQHLFRQPAGRTWRNTAGQVAPRVDTRANGGYICVTPSIVDGKRYRWTDSQSLHVSPEQLPEPPPWLVEVLDHISASQEPDCSVTSGDANPIPKGQRNQTLARLAGAMRRVGMSHVEILAALERVNSDRCTPPLPQREVDRIAASIARYAPDAVSVALAEDHFTQDFVNPPQQGPVSVHALLREHPMLRAPVIMGLLRRGETMNVIAPPKTGKALAIDTPILTEAGWMTMGELKPGMRVHAMDGSLTEVVAVSDVMYDRPCYRVTTRSGASVVADENHLWCVTQRDHAAVVTTKRLAAGRNGRRWLLPVPGALARAAVKLPLDPWVLGYWLGNGTAREGSISVNQDDLDEVAREIERAGFKLGKLTPKRGCVTFTILKLKPVLREMGLLRCKHIPEAYLLASQQQRAALFSGLLDSDGHATTQRNGSGTVEFTTTDPELFFQVLMLARSLGHKASTSVGRARLNGVDCGHKLRIWFAASRSHSPFRLSRRTAALPDRSVSQRSRHDAVKEVVPVPSVPVRCIEVAHPSGTFLAGRDFMVTHNSWLVLGLAMAVATGRPWLNTFDTVPGRALIIDNELHAETLAHRIPQVAEALSIGLDEIGETICVQSLRGQLRDLFSLRPYFELLEPRRFALVVLDAFYRFMPRDMDENDNATMASLYNHIDLYADRLGCCFVLIHHTTKGSQSLKSITDVGAGAGSQSRATDTHLVMRPHEEPGAVVLDAAVRSWPPIEPMALRWEFPIWTPAPDLDPTALRQEKPKRKGKTSDAEVPPDEQVRDFVERFLDTEPQTRVSILRKATTAGVSGRQAQKLLRWAVDVELAFHWGGGRYHPSRYATVPKPRKEQRCGNV